MEVFLGLTHKVWIMDKCELKPILVVRHTRECDVDGSTFPLADRVADSNLGECVVLLAEHLGKLLLGRAVERKDLLPLIISRALDDKEDMMSFLGTRFSVVVLSGGDVKPEMDEYIAELRWIRDCPLPILGICLGMQTLARCLDSRFDDGLSSFPPILLPLAKKRVGYYETRVVPKGARKPTVLEQEIVFIRYNHDFVVCVDQGAVGSKYAWQVPEGFQLSFDQGVRRLNGATIDFVSTMQGEHRGRRIFGLQGHPEKVFLKNQGLVNSDRMPTKEQRTAMIQCALQWLLKK
jgi:hypothetical protein